MHLLIRAVSLAGQPLTQAISAYFDERGGTIGRSDTNTLALPDPERRISRLQAELSRSPDGWRILNVGNANPIWHNNRPVPPGEGVLLDEGDELQVGSYALQVNYSRNDATARTITKGRAAVDSRTVIVGSGQEPRTDPGLMLPESRGGTVASPVAASAPAAPVAAPAPAPAPAPVASSSPFGDLLGFGAPAAPGASPAPAAASHLPDDFDPFADLLSTPSPSGRPAAAPSAWDLPQSAPRPASASPFDLSPGASALPGDLDLMGVVAAPGAQSLDQMFGLSGSASSSDPLAAFLKSTEPAAPAEAPAGAPSSMDPLALLASREEVTSASTAPVLPERGAEANHVPELNAAMSLPPVREPASEPLSATFSFLSPPSAKASPDAPVPADLDTVVSAEPAAASPFADLGLGTPARATLLDDLDLSSGTVPSVHVKADPIVDMSVSVSGSPVVEPLLTQLPIPQTELPHEPLVKVPVPAPVAAAVTPPAPAATPAPTPQAASSASGAAPADTQALWAAFCEGSGVKFVPPQGLNPDLMRVIGQLLHHAVDGSLKLVAARAATKQEMRAEVTVIQARRNNPLKFSPDTESAMEQLLQPPMRGFMSGPEAVADAMDDLLGHTIGTMVGMRAALDGVLARFQPEQLEAKLAGRSVVDSLLPMNRRAKLWELYLQHFEGVRSEAQDDFHNLFGRAFLQAYEEQLDRLDAERRQSGRQPGTPGAPA